MIVCDCLHKKFGTVTAVDGVSMEIKDGTFLGLLGPPCSVFICHLSAK